MPFVRIVEADPSLPHQLILYFAPGYTEYNISCNCMPSYGNGYRHALTTMSFEAIVASGMLASQRLIKVWREAHNPPLDDETVGDATAHRWVWVDAAGRAAGFGAG
jgi:hypothetical protein